MNTNIVCPRFAVTASARILFVSLAILGLLPVSAITPLRAQAGATEAGVITGNVSNQATGNLLEGAVIEVPQLGRTVLTDNTGRFVLTGIPPGTHEVVASYIGLDPVRQSVTVAAGQRVTSNFDLTTGIYKLEAFTVAGEREGNAAALTAQRNAPNVKNVVAIDAYGNLPNMNASELAVLLPGVAGELSDEGNIVGFTIRGMGPGSNTITIDGALMASQGAANRQTRMHTITGSMFDSLELTKGHTPDKGADSLGGTLNLKSRSPLSMKEKRRITYNFSARWAPPFTDQIPMREQHRVHPLLNVAYQEKFSVLGSSAEENLGVSVNLFYSEQALGFYRVTTDWQNTTDQPAYVWDFRTQDNYNNRKQSSVNTKFDYRLSANTKATLNLIYNDAMERFRLRYYTRAFTGNQNTVPNATTSGVIPGFTDFVTEVRPVAASTFDIQSQMSNFFHRQRHADLGFEHQWGPVELDYNGVVSLDGINGGSGDGGDLTFRATGVGWVLDRTNSDIYPTFRQTAGPSLSDPSTYRPQNFVFNDNFTGHEIREYRANLRYKLPTGFTWYAKAGVRWREEVVEQSNKNRRYIFTGTTAAQLPTDPTIRTVGMERGGLDIPQWHTNALARGRTPLDLSLWREDLYFREMVRFTGTRGVTETVSAAYLMTQGRIGRTGFVAGTRVEKTEDDSWGWVRQRFGSTAAQQLADPVGSAERDYADTFREQSGSYTKWFPSVHLTHDIRPNLKARASWSTSFGRPPLNNLMPNEAINETQQTVTINNPDLKPQVATNWDLSLEYYFEPVGNFSVGWFHKTIEDFFQNNVPFGIVPTGPNNGFNGEYEGFTLQGRGNLGEAVIKGWEFSYQQQLTFLPGVLRGLGVFANYTYLTTSGDWGRSGAGATSAVPGFIPRTGNIGVSWRHRGFSSNVRVNYTGDYLDAANVANPALNLFREERTIVNAGVAYQFRPSLALSVDVQNLFEEEQRFYRGYPYRLQSSVVPGINVTVGVSGRF